MNDMNWIPASEKLPESGVSVLISYGYTVGTAFYEDGENKSICFAKGWYSDKLPDGSYCEPSECKLENDAAVIAWMPLPKPYKSEE